MENAEDPNNTIRRGQPPPPIESITHLTKCATKQLFEVPAKTKLKEQDFILQVIAAQVFNKSTTPQKKEPPIKAK